MKIDLTSIVPNRGRVIRFPAVTISQTTENELYSIVMEGVRLWSKRIYELLIPEYSKPAPLVDGLTVDADGAQLQWIIDQIDREVNDRVFYQTEKLGRWVTKVGTSHTSKTISSVKSATGVEVKDFMTLRDIRPILDNSIRANVDLIKGLDADTKRRVEGVIFDGIARRRNQKYITKQLSLVMGISQRHARIIARDQTHKLNSLLTQLRNEQLGIEAYLWKTMMDDRVRRTHRAREGKLFKWDKPPEDGHAGYAINCRCHAMAVLYYG